MRVSLKKIILILLMLSIILPTAAGCSGNLRRGGTEIGPPADGAYDFTVYWLKSRSDVVAVIKDWRVGVMGNSVRITAGADTGTGIRSAAPLPGSYVLHAAISLENIGEQPFEAAVRLGAPENKDAPAVMVTRDNKGSVNVCFMVGNEVICESGGQKAKDGVFSMIIDNSGGDGKLRLYFTGDEGFSYNVLTDEVRINNKAEAFSMYTDTEGIVFKDIGVDATGYRKGDLIEHAKRAFADLTGNYWDGANGRLVKTFGGRTSEHDPSVWEVGVVMFAYETMYRLTGDEDIKYKAAKQWDYMKTIYSDRAFATTGGGPNPAVDDAGWTAMSLMTWYRLTGDEGALALVRNLVRNGYSYWMDGNTANGLWNSYVKDGIPWREDEKTIYCVGLLLSALDYHELTAGTDKEDAELFGQTLDLYNWIQEFLFRDKEKTYGDITVKIVDGLYYYSFWEKKDGRFHPESYANISIAEGNTNSSIMGNTAMAVIHRKLYDLTGLDVYKDRAVALANAIADSAYGRDGILISDFDPWVNASFMGRFVSEVLTLPGVSDKWSGLLKNTSVSIMKNSRTDDGYYKASWVGSNVYDDPRFRIPAFDMSPEVMMTSAQTVHMVIAAALGDKLGVVK